MIAGMWRRAAGIGASDDELPPRSCRPLPPGSGTSTRVRRTLRRIAEEGPRAFYPARSRGRSLPARGSTPDDLAAHAPEWVEPLRLQRGSALVCELPPNGQGAAALQAIGIADGLGLGRAATIDRVHLGAEAMKLAFADAYRHIAEDPCRDGYSTATTSRAARARRSASGPVLPAPARCRTGVPCTCAPSTASAGRARSSRACTPRWGSVVGVPGHGFALQNRGAGFASEDGHPNRIAPGGARSTRSSRACCCTTTGR